MQLQSYMHHSHITVKMVGVFIATGLIVVSILDIVGFAKTNVDSEPFNVRAFGYLHNAWNILFGVLMIFMDAPARWLGKMAPWQSTLWQKAHILAKARPDMFHRATAAKQPNERRKVMHICLLLLVRHLFLIASCY